jgi:RNA polymerase sigma-70 factor (ECF subfamily)
MTSSASSSVQPEVGDYFVSTRWTVVLSAGHKSSPGSDQALAELCQVYWYPLYAYARRQGRSREDAQDLVQAFFEKFLQKNYLEDVSCEHGKFRAFLLACLKHFLANEWDKATRQKRGGGARHLALDWQSADQRYQLEPPDNATPDRLYDREWAQALLARVLARLKEEYVLAGKGALFEHAKSSLMGRGEGMPHVDAAAGLDMDVGALRVAVHRLRARYREMLKEEIAQTLSDPAAVQEELRSLLQIGR